MFFKWYDLFLKEHEILGQCHGDNSTVTLITSDSNYSYVNVVYSLIYNWMYENWDFEKSKKTNLVQQ